MGGAAQSLAQVPPPESAEVSQPQTGPISGYMDFHFNKLESQDGVLDFHRFVLLFNHSFSSQIRFVGELELEHAFVEGLEDAGELELEQAYLDFLISRPFSVRAGMMLVPLGIINERHEPPVFHGVERPFVDTVIIPSTWFEVGAGIHGETGRGLRYRAFAMAPLDALQFSADEGIRGGRQKGAEANVRNVAFTGRLEYVGTPDLTLGAAFWTGDSSFSLPRLDTTVRVGEVDARYRRDRLELRGQFARVGISDAGSVNDAIERLTGVSPNIATTLQGFYAEAAYRVWASGSPRDLVAFFRYENFDTQYRMPPGFIPLKEFDRDAYVVGATYYPDPDVAVKIDYVHQRNRSGVIEAPSSVNVGLGWWF
ncbi:MAG TPA: hypothetical protein VFO14_16065 [Vicinamibacterales bacterium]|nr:hypothetical protein [Vicinamibacterales bacterium]